MIHVKDHKQLDLFDPWRFLSPRRRQLLDRTWPGLFQNKILPNLPVSSLFPFFEKEFGRPTKELHTVLGTLIFQQMFDLTDDEACDQLTFNIQWHYALNIAEESDSAKYMCPKTLWNMRTILINNRLDNLLFGCVTKQLADVFKVNTDNQRIDSIHIQSNMRRLGRIGIFASGIHKFLTNLKRNHTDDFNAINSDLIERYLPEKAMQCFSMVKPSNAHKTLERVSSDLFDLVMQFQNHPAVCDMHSYKQLERILKEQCNVQSSEDGPSVMVKKSKEIPSDSLQNPSDPDATYSGHKGQGYQVQIMETYFPAADKETRKTTLNLITHVEVEPAHKSDANALIPAIVSVREAGFAPREVLADSLYGGDDNCLQAQQQHVEIVAPAMGQKNGNGICLSDFALSETGDILTCPQGLAPVAVKKKKARHTAIFDSCHCSGCPDRTSCPVKTGKRHHSFHYTEKERRIANRRAYEHTDEFKDRYRWRSGIEATMSEYDRRTGVKQLRVRGFKAVKFCAILKAIGINLFRAAAVWMAIHPFPNDDKSSGFWKNYAFLFIKELFSKIWQGLKIFFMPFTPNFGHMLKT